MKIVMTLLVRDEADIVDAHLAFHLRTGVDLVIATDNCSQDATTEILERHEALGHLHLIREPSEDLRQTEWVSRMARLAASEYEADWVINSDADEFWLPRLGSFGQVLSTVPERYGVVRGAWRVFVPRPADDRPFAERMTVRLCRPEYHDHPFSTDRKSIHRARSDVRVGRGNHEVFGEGFFPMLGWFPIEVLHFPIRSLEQCTRKYVTQYHALRRNPDKGTPGIVASAYEAYRAGRPEDFYDPLVVDDTALERGLGDGTLTVDTRLRDALRAIADGEEPLRVPAPPLEDRTAYAAETSVIPEADVGLDLRARIEGMETRLERLANGPAARIRSALSPGRS
jgi:hypothetical protein